MDNSGTVNIYGHIPDRSELVIGIGDYNNIHGLLTYLQEKDSLQIQKIPDIVDVSVLELVLIYERPLTDISTNRVYFSLGVKDIRDDEETRLTPILKLQTPTKYINVKIELNDDKPVACACLSPEKAFFWIDYSSIDKIPRSQLLAGSLYALKTIFGEQEYMVSWKISGISSLLSTDISKPLIQFDNQLNILGNLIMFLPTTWYERSLVSTNASFCERHSNIHTLIQNLSQLNFKGYTTQQWCEEVPAVNYCTMNDQCGDCLGQCQDPNTICYINPEISNLKSLTPGNLLVREQDNPQFICGSRDQEPKLDHYNTVSFSQDSPQITGNTATWVAVISIIIIISLLTWGIVRKSSSYDLT